MPVLFSNIINKLLVIMKKQYKKIQIEVKGIDVDKSILDAVFSTADKDRHGDIVEQNFDLKSFKKNPVLLNSHDYSDAAQVIGKVDKLSTKSGSLEGKVKFAIKENPKAQVIFDLYAGGFLNAFSIGFIPLEFDDKGKITKSELLEISAVSVPANAMATAKAKGIDVDALTDEEVEVGVKAESDVETEIEPESEEEVEKVEDKEEEEKTPEDAEMRQSEAVEPKKLSALKRIVEKREQRRKELLKESLVVIRQLESEQVSKAHRKQMVNRVVRQLLKVKD